jgi:hypothetical protein
VNQTVFADAGLTDSATLLTVLPGATGLPVRFGPRARLGPKSAATMDLLSRKLRIYLAAAAPPGPDGHRPPPDVLAAALRQDRRGKRCEWLRAEAVPTLMQMLMPEDAPVRGMLVELLAEIPGPVATEALARRAVFDLDPAVRARAAEALHGRPASVWRPVLLAALRYPWPPAADHAAEALATLEDRDSVPALVTLLKEPDPSAPRRLRQGGALVREVVRAAHLNNCLLCHPPALSGDEPVIGLDPVLTVPQLSRSGSAAQRVQGTAGSHNYGGGRGSPGSPGSSGGFQIVQVPLPVRGDTTYLRQDFSVQLTVANVPVAAGPAPAFRYDYFLRTRRLTKAELSRLKDPPAAATYPQREAVLFALRSLTGRDPGPATEAWVRLFPTAHDEVEGAKLAGRFAHANALGLARLLALAETLPDGVAVRGLGGALPRLRGEPRDKVHAALVARLARLDADALRGWLHAAEPELRRAAVAACGRREDAGLVADLVALTEGDDPAMAGQASGELEKMTGRRVPSPAAWRDWWKGLER